MGDIVIIDNNHIRRAALRNALLSLDHGLLIEDYASVQDEIKAGWLKNNSVILLHVGKAQDEDTLHALQGRYKEFMVVCYSGGVEAAKVYKAHQGQNKNHCWYDRAIENTISDNIKKNFNDFFKSLREGVEDNLCQRLNSMDTIKEAKLEILSLIAEERTLHEIQDTQPYNKLNGEGLVTREDVEGALSNRHGLRSLRTRWFPE